MGSETPEKWEGAYISHHPIKVNDINQNLLYYRFDITKEGQVIGTVMVSGNKLMEKTILRFEDELNPYSKNLKEIEKNCGKSDMPLIVGYRSFGLGILVNDEKEVYIEDIVTGEQINIRNIPNTFDLIDKESIISRVNNWDQEYNYFKKMDKEDFIHIGKTETKSYTNWCHLEGVSMILQPSNSNWCGVATAKMAASYYGVYHSWSYILDVMGIESTSEGATYEDIDIYMEDHVGVSCTLPNSAPPAYSEYKSRIGTRGNPGNPVIEGIIWAGGGAHYRLITAWYEASESPREYVYVHCPGYGPGLEAYYGSHDPDFTRNVFGGLNEF